MLELREVYPEEQVIVSAALDRCTDPLIGILFGRGAQEDKSVWYWN